MSVFADYVVLIASYETDLEEHLKISICKIRMIIVVTEATNIHSI